jgi:uncharacterized membrane protein YdjX (TVP38/TMEM64 family)
LSNRLHRHAEAIRWAALAVIFVSLLLLLRQMPVAELDEALRGWIGGLGPWGPVAFVGVYLAWALMLLPASLLTVVAGAVWGLVWGTVYVMIGACITVSLSFLISRHVARDQVLRFARRSVRFRALDEAITEGGWRIVALVRLTPVFPFGLQNYMYGLTGIGFWACVGVSVVTMVPGTFLFVYLGHLTRTGAAVAAGDADATGEAWVWALRVLGLFAAIGVVAYITHLARRRLKEITRNQPDHFEDDEGEEEDSAAPAQPTHHHRLPWRSIAMACLAMAMLAGSVYAQFNPELVRNLFSVALDP